MGFSLYRGLSAYIIAYYMQIVNTQYWEYYSIRNITCELPLDFREVYPALFPCGTLALFKLAHQLHGRVDFLLLLHVKDNVARFAVPGKKYGFAVFDVAEYLVIIMQIGNRSFSRHINSFPGVYVAGHYSEQIDCLNPKQRIQQKSYWQQIRLLRVYHFVGVMSRIFRSAVIGNFGGILLYNSLGFFADSRLKCIHEKSWNTAATATSSF